MMKVTRKTPDQLIVSDTPWLIGILLIGFILAFVGPGLIIATQGGENLFFGLLFAVVGGGMGFVAFAVFVQRVQVILDRPSDTITIRRQNLFGYRQVQHKLSNLSRAVLEETRGSKGGTLYRPTLVLDDGMSAGHHPIVTAYTNTRGPRRLADAINGWLAQEG